MLGDILNLDKRLPKIGFVEDVDKLSPLFVDNSERASRLWKMWISYPHFLWIT